MEAMKQFPDNAFDLAVVDPPYGINADKFSNCAGLKDHGKGQSTAQKLKAKGRLNSGSGKLKNRVLNQSDCSWDSAPPSREYFNELFRVSKNQIIWGGNYFDLPPTRGIIVWDKMQPWENFSQVELAWTSFDRPAALFKYCNAGGATQERKIHPTQKPVALYEWIFKKYSKPGDKILDTHLGSGSSRIAAYNAGLYFIGYEINELYFNLQEQRFEEHTSQQNLFLMGEAEP
jgi:site-specific DNA-methyltransferase (adenine-specific)